MDTIEHLGYRGSVRFSGNDEVFHGQIIGISDVITFEGETVKSLVEDFHAAVSDYLETCAEIGKDPQRAYSGKIPLRIDPVLHRKVAIEAESTGTSVNGWISDVLNKKTAAG